MNAHQHFENDVKAKAAPVAILNHVAYHSYHFFTFLVVVINNNKEREKKNIARNRNGRFSYDHMQRNTPKKNRKK
ncbi:MAG: hypothetical protein EOP56_18025 [Sphingobacteriales bacterium]|nr:MAG: hypothetical protein EOP56_18025 [Sphingobacteriales bacterium]